MIFILGGRGFVGSAFVRLCKAQGRPYVILDRSNYAHYVGQACDIFINTDGNSKKFMAERDPLWEFDASVRSVRASLIDFKFQRYVYLSSCDVYADCSQPAVTSEEQSLDVAPQSPYGFHKYLAEECVRHGANNWLILRLGGCVGPGLKKNAIYDILNGGPLWLDPESELQYIYTDHAAEITLHLIDRGIKNEVFNVCGRGVIRLQEVIAIVGHEVSVQPGSPAVRYEISVEKLSKLVDVPETHTTVPEFVREMLQRAHA